MCLKGWLIPEACHFSPSLPGHLPCQGHRRTGTWGGVGESVASSELRWGSGEQGSSRGSGSRPGLPGPWVTFCPGSLCMWVSRQLGWLQAHWPPAVCCGCRWPHKKSASCSHGNHLGVASGTSSFSICLPESPGQPGRGHSTTLPDYPSQPLLLSQMNERTLEPKATKAPRGHHVTVSGNHLL